MLLTTPLCLYLNALATSITEVSVYFFSLKTKFGYFSSSAFLNFSTQISIIGISKKLYL